MRGLHLILLSLQFALNTVSYEFIAWAAGTNQAGLLGGLRGS